MIMSMTGFGRGECQKNGKEFLVELKTVNHRYIDMFIKLPRQISYLEDKVRELISKTLSRGKIDVFVSYEDRSDDSKNVLLDEPLAAAYIKAFDTIKAKYNLKDDITVSTLTRLPDVLKVEKQEADEEETWNILKEALENALSSLVSMRSKEGMELKNSILDKVDFIENIIKDIEKRAPDVVLQYRQKLSNRLKELLDQQTVDETRLAMEVAVFADRCSIDEELVRLSSHINQLRGTLDIDQPVGRKLDFLVQEMNREVNTIGSKANDLAITKCVVDIKSEIEKIREQIQNIE